MVQEQTTWAIHKYFHPQTTPCRIIIKDLFSTNDAGSSGSVHGEKNNLIYTLYHEQIQLQVDCRLLCKRQNYKSLEENIGEYLYNLELHNI